MFLVVFGLAKGKMGIYPSHPLGVSHFERLILMVSQLRHPIFRDIFISGVSPVMGPFFRPLPDIFRSLTQTSLTSDYKIQIVRYSGITVPRNSVPCDIVVSQFLENIASL